MLADVDDLILIFVVAVRRAAFRVIKHIVFDIRQRAVTLADRSGAVAALSEYRGHCAVKIGIDLLRFQRKERVARLHFVADLRGIVADHAAVRRKDGLCFARFDIAVYLRAFRGGGPDAQRRQRCQQRHADLLHKRYFLSVIKALRWELR